MKPTATFVYAAYVIPGLLAPVSFFFLVLMGAHPLGCIIGTVGTVYGLYHLGEWCQAFYFRGELTAKERFPRLGRFVVC